MYVYFWQMEDITHTQTHTNFIHYQSHFLEKGNLTHKISE